MLVLTRKANERVVIGPNIEMTVVGVRGDRVMLGFEAPNEVSIRRSELCLRTGSDETGELVRASDSPRPPEGL